MDAFVFLEIEMAGEMQEEVGQDVDDAEMQAAFDAQMDQSKAPTETPEPAEKPEEQEKAVEKVVEPEPVVATPPAIEYAQITKSQFDDLMAKASSVDKAFGKIGGIERQLQAEGQPVVFTADDFPEMAREFPELVDAHVKDMNKAMARFKVPKAESVDIDRLVNDKLSTTRQEMLDSHLDSIVGNDWKQEVITDGFKKWAEKQPQDLINSTSLRDASTVLRNWAIEKNKPAPVIAQPKPSSRSQRLQAAVAPKGTGGNQPSNPNTDEAAQAAFEAQFKD